MRFREAVFPFVVLLASCGAAVADTPPAHPAKESPFTFPSEPLPPKPPAPPTPKPGGVPLLLPDSLYVVSSKVDAVVRVHPAGGVRITKEAGPIRIRGKFIDGSGKVETRTFPGPFVFVVEATPGKQGRVEIDFIPLGLKSEDEIVSKVLDVGQVPPVPPKPPAPPPKPVDPVEPLKSFRVIFIYESGDNLTPEQRAVVYGKVTEDYLNANCTGGKQGWRRRDKDAPGEADQTMSALWAAVQPKVTATPCVALERNGKVTIVSLEATPAAMVAVLEKYKGGK